MVDAFLSPVVRIAGQDFSEKAFPVHDDGIVDPRKGDGIEKRIVRLPGKSDPEKIEKLRDLGCLKKDGLTPQQAAESIKPFARSLNTGKKLISAILRAGDKDALIERETTQRCLEKHSDLFDSTKVDKLVTKAIHTEARSRLVANELRYLAANRYAEKYRDEGRWDGRYYYDRYDTRRYTRDEWRRELERRARSEEDGRDWRDEKRRAWEEKRYGKNHRRFDRSRRDDDRVRRQDEAVRRRDEEIRRRDERRAREERSREEDRQRLERERQRRDDERVRRNDEAVRRRDEEIRRQDERRAREERGR